ncbi:Mo25 domain-containing protein [Rhizoctonia solani AG-1 IA]|uniref:Mo25 domain-containing protein n=1 Tax=Thanatephorus cucumeris (strain AG1-IA) TaxID=983506 RepID=L8X182_THACA|nr:Mo25 domain-containing protein [Rhizoctonia solani AG-1 IA]
MMMNLLRDKSRNIQFEAFHVFKQTFGYGSGGVDSQVLILWRGDHSDQAQRMEA